MDKASGNEETVTGSCGNQPAETQPAHTFTKYGLQMKKSC